MVFHHDSRDSVSSQLAFGRQHPPRQPGLRQYHRPPGPERVAGELAKRAKGMSSREEEARNDTHEGQDTIYSQGNETPQECTHRIIGEHNPRKRKPMTQGETIRFELFEALLRCPNEGGQLEARGDGREGLLRCRICSRLFPIDDGIAILLPDGKRNPRLELSLLARLGRLLGGESWAADLAETLAVVKQTDRPTVWEWEDVEFWDRHYASLLEADARSDWTYRLQQRKDPVDRAFRGLGSGLTIVDVGAGEGQTTPELLPNVFRASTYIALDMSFQGLRLNRSRHRPTRGIYLLASADHPPLAEAVADVITFYGVLHHAERKVASLAEYCRKLKPGGRLLLAEAVARPRIARGLLSRVFPTQEVSAHEERIPLDQLRRACQECGKMVYYRQYYTAFYSLLSRVKTLRRLLVASGTMHRWVIFADDLVSRTLGALVPIFRAGEILAVLQRRE